MSRRSSSSNGKTPKGQPRKPRRDETELDVPDGELLMALSQLNLSMEVLEPEVCKTLVPKCIHLLDAKDLKVRVEAVTTLFHQLRFGNKAMKTHCEDLCKALQRDSVMIPKVESSGDGENLVMKYQRGLSGIITSLQYSYPDIFVKHCRLISEFLVQWTGSDKAEQTVAGCEYWAKITSPPVPVPFVQMWMQPVVTTLPVLVPNLMKCMVYRDRHSEFLEQYGSTTAENSHLLPLTPDVETFSNIRNYAALGFENISRIFPSEVVPVFRPLLEKWLTGDDWRQMEAAVLAFSAFTEATGMPPSMRDVYPTVVPKILQFLAHPKPLIRSIACFAMPHFVNLSIKGLKDPTPKVLRSVTVLLKDDCLEVRSIAIRSLATILAYCMCDIGAHLGTLVESLVSADEVMTGESRSVYFECIGHLFGRTAPQLSADDVKQLLAPVMQQWKDLEWKGKEHVESADQVSIVRLCQTLCVIANFSKSLFVPYTPEIFAKASVHLEKIVESSKNGSNDEKSVDIITGHLVAYLDLLSAIFDGQGADAFKYMSLHNVVKILHEILLDSSLHNKVHQSTLALLGHLAQHATGPMEPSLDAFVDIIASKISNHGNKSPGPRNPAKNSTDEVVNNALWALVFITKDKNANREKLFGLVNDLIRIFKQTSGHPGCIVNAAWALTTMCALWPKQTVGVIVKEDVFLHLSCLLQTQFPRELEKVEIFKNICSVISLVVPKIPPEFWTHFLAAAALMTTLDEDLEKSLNSLVHEIRTTLGNAGWSKLSQEMGPQLSYTLRKKYKLY